MKMPRRSRVLDKLRLGQNVYSIKFNLDSSRAVEIAGLNDFDCGWICDEHISADASLVERQILASKVHDMDMMVRVQRGSYSDLIKPLELDASGIMVPHVMSASDASMIIRNCRFFPLGMRPLDGGNADGMFCLYPSNDYYEFVNHNRFILLQIEDKEAMSELEEICKLPGFDIIFFGPGDFSQSIGQTGNINHPEVLQARKKVAECAKKYGKFAGTVGNIDNVEELHKEGYKFVNLGADVIGLGQYFTNIKAKMQLLNKE